MMRSAQPNGWQPSPPSPRPPSDRWLRFTPSAAAPLDSTLASELRAVLYWNRILPLKPRAASGVGPIRMHAVRCTKFTRQFGGT